MGMVVERKVVKISKRRLKSLNRRQGIVVMKVMPDI